MPNTTKPDSLELLRELKSGITLPGLGNIIAALEAERREYEVETNHLRAMLHAADKQFESIAKRDAKIRAVCDDWPLEHAAAISSKVLDLLDGGRDYA